MKTSQFFKKVYLKNIFYLKFQLIDRNAKSGQSLTKSSNVNLVDSTELVPINGKNVVLGEGCYGRCILKHFTRLGIRVVEKQSLNHDTGEMLKEAKVMQALTHKNIPAIIGVQLEKQPISLIIEFKGEQDTSVTISKLLSSEEDDQTLQNVQTSLTKNDWLIISHDLTEALSHIHFKGFLHCDLKSNNVLVSNKHGYIIDFGKACDSSFPPAKKYSIVYSHIAPEVLTGSPCSKASDIFSLGKILLKVGGKHNIPILVSTAQKCLDANPARRPTTTGIMATIASAISY